MFFNVKKKESYNYFDKLAALSEYSLEAARYLDQVLTDYQLEKSDEYIGRMHKIEQAADQAKQELMEKLTKEFLPPIDKDDIIILSHQIDEVTDTIEDALIFADIRDLEEIQEDTKEFTRMIIDSCLHVNLALEELGNFRKSVRLKMELEFVHRNKSESKALFVRVLENLHNITGDPARKIIATEYFNSLLDCCTCCKIVTNTIERIVIKNL